MSKKKVVLIGTGSRGTRAYVKPLTSEKYKDYVEFCGVCDQVRERAELCSSEYGNIPVFDDFDTMLDTVHPDYVIVTTMDSNHHEYVINALEKGYDVITEKPLTNTRKKALEIMEAEKRTGHTVNVIFNLRFQKPLSDIKQLLVDGVIGDITHIDFTWLLNRRHGADYFRRWHRYIDNTTSLLVHKSTHHFDGVNWITGKKPVSVFARGTLEFYGKNGPYRGECCHTCEHASECPLYFDVTKDPFNKKYYLDLEEFSGYHRDGCLFAEDINIFDRMALNVLFEDGATMNYDLVAYSPDEGFRMSLMGTKGRLEYEQYTSGPRAGAPLEIKIIDLEDKETVIETASWDPNDSHGGSDGLMLEKLFGLSDDPDTLGRLANSYAGYLSLAVGDMAVQSIRTGKDIKIDECLE